MNLKTLLLLAVLGTASLLPAQIVNGGSGGASFPLTSPTANPASAGSLRLANNTDKIEWNNAAGNANLAIYFDASNVFQIPGTLNVGSLTTGGTGADTYTAVVDPACSTSFLFWASTTTANTFKYCDGNSNIKTVANQTGTSGGIPYYSSATAQSSSGALTANVLIKGGGAGAAPAVSLITENGTTAAYTGTGGYVAPTFVANGSGAGAFVATAGTAQGHATASTVTIEAPAAVTAYEIIEPGASASGFTYGTNSAAVRTESFGELSGDVTTSGSLATTVAKVNGIGIQRVTMVADWTCGTSSISTSCTAATIVGTNGTPLTITLPSVAASYHLHCEGVVGQATAATSNQWNLLTATNGATNVTATYKMATAATASAYGAVTDQASTTTTFQIAPNWTLGGTATKMPFSIDASIEGASASGTVVSLQLLAPTAADVVTIYRGAFCSVGPF